jgi:hypothetical protein
MKRRETLNDLMERTAVVGDCIEWQGAISSSTGYGKTKFRGQSMDTHRAVWVAAHGAIPSGLFVMHSCDNRKCVSLDHLSLGTHSDNMKDAGRKGRLSLSAAYGERASNAALSTADVISIRERLARGETTVSIARDYPVTYSAISKIKRGIRWSRALSGEVAA